MRRCTRREEAVTAMKIVRVEIVRVDVVNGAGAAFRPDVLWYSCQGTPACERVSDKASLDSTSCAPVAQLESVASCVSAGNVVWTRNMYIYVHICIYMYIYMHRTR